MNGIILRQTKVRDNDAIVDWLIDKDMVITTAANRIHGSQSFPSGLELMNVYEIECTRRSESSMIRLRSAYSTERFDGIIADMPAYACAGAALEAVSNVCPPDSTVIDLFSSLLSVFAVMGAVPEYAATALAWFECFLLNQLGAMPNLEMCAQCARHLEHSSWFQQEVGFYCPICAQGAQNVEPFVLPAVRRLRYQSLRRTMQNAAAGGAPPAQFRRILMPVLRFFTAVMCDNSSFRWMKAHRFMAEMAFNAPDMFPDHR